MFQGHIISRVQKLHGRTILWGKEIFDITYTIIEYIFFNKTLHSFILTNLIIFILIIIFIRSYNVNKRFFC